MQKHENFSFQGSQEHFLHKSAIWDRTPSTYISNAVYMCAGGFKGPKSSNKIQLSQFVKKVMAFLVISLSPHGPRVIPLSPCCPHIVPTSSTSSPHHPHIIPIAPRRSQCGPSDLWSPWSPWSPPHVVPVVPVIPLSSPSSSHHPHHPHII